MPFFLGINSTFSILPLKLFSGSLQNVCVGLVVIPDWLHVPQPKNHMLPSLLKLCLLSPLLDTRTHTDFQHYVT